MESFYIDDIFFQISKEDQDDLLKKLYEKDSRNELFKKQIENEIIKGNISNFFDEGCKNLRKKLKPKKK